MNDYFIQYISDWYKYITVQEIAWKTNDLSTENLLDPVLNYTEHVMVVDSAILVNTTTQHCFERSAILHTGSVHINESTCAACIVSLDYVST